MKNGRLHSSILDARCLSHRLVALLVALPREARVIRVPIQLRRYYPAATRQFCSACYACYALNSERRANKAA